MNKNNFIDTDIFHNFFGLNMIFTKLFNVLKHFHMKKSENLWRETLFHKREIFERQEQIHE